MRTWGRIYNTTTDDWDWTEVSTDANGQDDYVWLTTLIQVLKLNLGESPFYANYGIPAQPSVISQIFPDFYVAQVQSQFSQYFASLQIVPVRDAVNEQGALTPTYTINILTNVGVSLSTTIAV